MAGAPAGSPGTPVGSTVAALRRTRFLGQQYADVTKLRELATHQERLAARYEQRIARINTKIERLRHQATLLREKAQKVLAATPEIEQEIKQMQRDIDAGTARGGSGPLTSDITALHYRVRKLQQRIVDLQQKAKALEHRAAQRTQRTAELKVKADRFVEAAHLASQEAAQYRQRADRLQQVIEQENAPGAAAAAPAGPSAPAGATIDPPASPPP